MQGCAGPTLNADLYRPCTIGRAVQELHYMHGFTGPALYYAWLCMYSPALFAGLYRPYTIPRAVLASYYTQYWPCNIRRDLQALHCIQGIVGPLLNTGLYRPCTICRPYTNCRSVQVLHYRQGCTGPALYTGICSPSTIRRAV